MCCVVLCCVMSFAADMMHCQPRSMCGAAITPVLKLWLICRVTDQHTRHQQQLTATSPCLQHFALATWYTHH
jgi:hypothetical protein